MNILKTQVLRNFCHFALALIALPLLPACGNTSGAPDSSEPITDTTTQTAIFDQLIGFANGALSDHLLTDSLAFLVLPVEASCPSCRKKTIDSIIKHTKDLPDRHYILLSASGGRKLINSFFQEQGQTLPKIKNRLFIDSSNQVSKYGLAEDNPAFYYSVNRRVYRKVSAIPATIRNDLREFFYGSEKNQRQK